MAPCRLSVIVISYNMARELPRTIQSLAAPMQRDIAREEFEIIVVDNGSNPPIDERVCAAWDANISFHRMANPSVSPAAAVNFGLRQARGSLIGVMIDGARLASPGLLSSALRASNLFPQPVIASLGFHLGPAVQMQSVAAGYNQQVEDELLAKADWTSDGYRLFEISTFAGSSQHGWFHAISESNALFLRQSAWQELRGFDEAFTSAGGGLVNLDIFSRACELPSSQLVYLLGEGTFHQVHGGVATNAFVSPWPQFHDEYVRVRGKPFMPPTASPFYFGRVPPAVLPSIESSAQMARQAGT